MKNPSITQVSQDFDANVRYPVTLPSASVVAHATTAPVTNTIASKNHTNTGAAAPTVITLPSADTMALQGFRYYLTVAQQVSLSPLATERIYLAGSGVLDKDLVIAGVIGNYADVYSDGASWYCVGHSGAVTKEV
jgi:hypothetical protein